MRLKDRYADEWEIFLDHFDIAPPSVVLPWAAWCVAEAIRQAREVMQIDEKEHPYLPALIVETVAAIARQRNPNPRIALSDDLAKALPSPCAAADANSSILLLSDARYRDGWRTYCGEVTQDHLYDRALHEALVLLYSARRIFGHDDEMDNYMNVESFSPWRVADSPEARKETKDRYFDKLEKMIKEKKRSR